MKNSAARDQTSRQEILRVFVKFVKEDQTVISTLSESKNVEKDNVEK